MFNNLRKRLQQAIGRITGKEEKPAEAPQEESLVREEIVQEIKEKPEEPRKVVQEPPAEQPEKIHHAAPAIKEEIPAPEKKPGLLARVIKRVEEKTLDEEEVAKFLSELQVVLLESDVAVEAAEKICSSVKAGLVGSAVKRGDAGRIVRAALRNALYETMNQKPPELEEMIAQAQKPFLIALIGFNGTGKTTTAAKLAHRLRRFSPVLAAGDTFRAASIEQLEEHAARLKMKVIKHQYGADSAAVIFDAVKHAAASGSKLVLADTAGRSHASVNLMDELKKVCRVNSPDLKILVLDALAGNDIYEQARTFNDVVGVDAIILTKTDVYEKGSPVSAGYAIRKPILFLGTGQGYGDLKEFRADEAVEKILG